MARPARSWVASSMEPNRTSAKYRARADDSPGSKCRGFRRAPPQNQVSGRLLVRPMLRSLALPRWYFPVLLGSALYAGFGCAYLRRASVPMEALHFVSRGPERARGVIVLLPGFGDRPSAFADHGF